MPRTSSELLTAGIDAELDAERRPSPWDRWSVSRNGNWCARVCGQFVTIFSRDGSYRYSVASRRKRDGVRFSPRSYPTAEAARDAAVEELEGVT